MSTVLSPADCAVDRQLAEISESFRFLLDLTPVNAGEARDDFLAGRGERPVLDYRPLEDDPAGLHAELARVDVDAVDDPTVAHLARAKRRELELQLEMLAARGTADFRSLSIELYGAVTPALLEDADSLLATLQTNVTTEDGSSCLDAEAIAALARAEVDHYRAFDPDLFVRIQIRDDCSGVLVVDGDLLISSGTEVSPERAAALLHHEIGTHVLTYANGCRQPLRLLAAGLAGYEETQEGLALVAEHLAGGLTAARLRQIAARVVAVHGMTEGRSFRDVHSDLMERGFTAAGAFAITLRVFRSGGLTKDLVYLRGLADLVTHVRSVSDLDVLWLGKMGLADAPLVQELWERGALHDPLLRPRVVDDPAAVPRLRTLVDAGSVLELVGE
jgi:uncharacterized protein (TIGR02421 family)